MRHLALLLTLAVLTGGCLNLELLEGDTTPEGAVIVNFTAHGSGGAPATGMEAGDFEILEDGELVSEFESQQTILNPKAQFRLVSLLLLDMSGSILESGNLSALQEAAVAYVEATTSVSEVGIYRFDGREDIIPVVEVTDDIDELRTGIESLSGVCDEDACDPSTNLNGAVIDGLGLLDDVESGSPRIFGGSVVVFTDGTDRASRASDDDAIARVRGSGHDVYSIGLGGEVDRGFLNKVGKSGTVYADDAAEVSEAFADVAQTVADEARSFYSLVYCSPSRAGRHEVMIRGAWGALRGTLKYQFDADGFDGTCDPSESAVAGDDDAGDDDAGDDDAGDDDVGDDDTWVEPAPCPQSVNTNRNGALDIISCDTGERALNGTFPEDGDDLQSGGWHRFGGATGTYGEGGHSLPFALRIEGTGQGWYYHELPSPVVEGYFEAWYRADSSFVEDEFVLYDSQSDRRVGIRIDGGFSYVLDSSTGQETTGNLSGVSFEPNRWYLLTLEPWLMGAEPPETVFIRVWDGADSGGANVQFANSQSDAVRLVQGGGSHTSRWDDVLMAY